MTADLSNEEVERAVLGACILDDKARGLVLDRLKEEHFYFDAHRRVFQALMSLEVDGTKCDIITLRDRLRKLGHAERVGGSKELAALLDAPVSLTAVSDYIGIIIDLHWRRTLRQRCDEVSATAGVAPRQELEGKVEALAWGSLSGDQGAPESISEVLPRVHDLWSPKSISGHPGVTTGLVGLDKVLVRMSPGNVIILAARPGIGKTALAINTIALNVAKSGLGVVVFELEMTKNELVGRMICSQASIDSRVAMSGKMNHEQWSKATEASGVLFKLPIVIDDYSRSVQQFSRAVSRAQKRFEASKVKLGLIVVDYLQLMTTSGRARTREEGVSENSRELKALARRVGVPIVLISQMNREIERDKKRKPRLADLRESGAIEQDADVVMFIWGGDEEDNSDVSPMSVVVVKGRHFGTGECRVTFEKRYTRFGE